MDLNSLTGVPFTTAEARRRGVTDDMLRSKKFRRLYRGIYMSSDEPQTFAHRAEAARLAMPPDAHLSHISRLHAAGLDRGRTDQIHFTIARDLHLARTNSDLVLHRTPALPPVDSIGVTPAAALIQLAGCECLIEVLRIGDWLMRNNLVGDDLLQLCDEQPWRRGAVRVAQFASWFSPRSASFPETDCRVLLRACGLPEPAVNVAILDSPHSPIADLWLPELRLAVEHEGRHHFADPAQVKRDVWRYSVMREHDIRYLQVHREMLSRPKAYVQAAYRAMVRCGYQGAPPQFGRTWRLLWRRPRSTNH